MKVKTIYAKDCERLKLEDYPNFSKSGSIKIMKDRYYGKNALLVVCGSYIYNVSSNPDVYYNYAH